MRIRRESLYPSPSTVRAARIAAGWNRQRTPVLECEVHEELSSRVWEAFSPGGYAIPSPAVGRRIDPDTAAQPLRQSSAVRSHPGKYR